MKFIDAVDSAAGKLAKVMELGTPLEYSHYKDIRVTGKQEDYKYPCCNSPYGEPTIYDASKYTYSVGGELGFIAKKTIGASLVLNFIPVTKPIEKWTGIGARIDSVLQKLGGGCQLRALIEGNVNVGLSKWAPAAPCEKCPIEMNASGSVLGGGAVQIHHGTSAVAKAEQPRFAGVHPGMGKGLAAGLRAALHDRRKVVASESRLLRPVPDPLLRLAGPRRPAVLDRVERHRRYLRY